MTSILVDDSSSSNIPHNDGLVVATGHKARVVGGADGRCVIREEPEERVGLLCLFHTTLPHLALRSYFIF